MQDKRHLEFHFLTVLVMGLSASLWAVSSVSLAMVTIWLVLLCLFVLILDPKEFPKFFRRLANIGLTLFGVSILQIIFRRNGNVVLWAGSFPLIYSDGLREAFLLWIRFMILFVLARTMAFVSLFHFMLFMNKIKISLNMGFLLLITVKMIPFILSESKRILWFSRFRGIRVRELSLKDRLRAIKQLFSALIIRGIDYVFHSAMALELRGYGVAGIHDMKRSYRLKSRDWTVIFLLTGINIGGFFMAA